MYMGLMSTPSASLNERGSVVCSPTTGIRVPTPPPVPPSSSSPAYIEQLRQQLSNGLQTHPELRDLLGLCAESNDWTVEDARKRPDSIVVMELFLLQVHQVPLVKYFPNLVTIKFMNIGLESIADFASLTHVEELWLSDNNIRVIEGLDNMTKLRRLFLQGNCITSLEGLPPLRHLRELWLSRNQLSRLTHLTPLRKLRSFYAADNPIEYLDGAFSKDMAHLHELNLSGCHLADLAQLCYLQQLPSLRNVWFLDPLFGDNPICRVNNYTTLVLSMLDSLDSLDGTYVTAEQRSLAESIVKKKTSYYEMRVQMIEANLVLLARHAEGCAMREMAQNAEALAQLHACAQPIKAELLERQLYRGSDNIGSLFRSCKDGQQQHVSSTPAAPSVVAVESARLESLRLQLDRAVSTCEIQEQKMLLRLAHATASAFQEAQLLKERLAMELHTAGNVRLEPVSTNHEYFVSVNKLMQDRFNRDLFLQQFNVNRVAVNSVRRVVNRGLRFRFDDRVKELHADLADPQQRSRFVGLFGMVPTTTEGQSACLQHALLCGAAADDSVFTCGSAASRSSKRSTLTVNAPYTPTPADEGVPLTDSLFYADEARLRALSSGFDSCAGADGRGNGAGPNASFSFSQVYSNDNSSGGGVVCHGQLVLYRTYLHKAVAALGSATGSAVSKDDGSGNRGGLSHQSFVQRAGRILKKDYGAGITAVYRMLPSSTSETGKTDTAADAASTSSSSYVWYCFDRALILADCVVDYCYTVAASPLTRTSPSSVQLSSSLVTANCAAPTPLNHAAVMALLFSVCMPCTVGAPGGKGGEGSANKEKAPAETAASVGRDVREDLLSCATPLLQFVHWCGGLPSESRCMSSSGVSDNNNTSSTIATTTSSHPHRQKSGSAETGHGGNTLKIVAVKETAEAIESVTAVLGVTLTSQLLKSVPRKTSNSNIIQGALLNALAEDGTPRPLQVRDVENYAARMHVTAGNGGPLTLCVLRDLGLTAVWKDFACPLLASVTMLDLSQNSLIEFSWFALAKETPQLQKLYLRDNRLVSFPLDGSRLPALRTLDLSNNLLANIADFREIHTAAPALEELDVRGNPIFASQVHQDAEAQLWFYLSPPSSFNMSAPSTASLVKLNQHPMGTYPGTLAVQRYRRACIIAGGSCASPRTTRVMDYLALRMKEMSRAAGSVAAALFSVDGVSVPERYVSAVVAQLEQWEATDTLSENVAEALRGPQAGSAASPSAPPGSDAAAYMPVTPCVNDCQDFCWNYGLLDTMSGLVSRLPNLRRVVLRGHALANVDAVLQLNRLESLNVAENRLTALPCLAGLKSLTELVVDFNHLTSLPAQIGPLPTLRVLSAAGNKIAHVDASLFLDGSGSSSADASNGSAPATSQLETLHLSHNAIADMNIIYALREIPSLIILSVMGNPCTSPDSTRRQQTETDLKAAADDTRQYLIHVFQQLKVLDGGAISAAESARAREIYAGKINTDLLIERSQSQPDSWAEVRNLSLARCTLTEVALLEPFVGLEVLQLQHNLLSAVSGLSTLTHLRALDLSHNRIGAAAWRNADRTNTSLSSSSPHPQSTSTTLVLGDALAPLKLLESLSLESNQLTDLGVLKLRLPRLKFLNARGNDLQFLQRGLEQLPDLRELLLDQNKLRSLTAACLTGNRKLTIFSAEGNGLKTLEGLRGCARLEQLRLGANRLGELKATLADLQACPLKVLVLIGNPVARKSSYRSSVISYFPQLVELDRRPITQEEREKAETARVAAYVAPPNVVIDMDFLAAAAAGLPTGSQVMPMSAGVNGSALSGAVARTGSTGLPSRNRLANPSAAVLSGLRRGGGGGAGGPDRFNVNPRSRPYRR